MPNALSPKPNALAPKGNALMRAYEPGIMDNARWYAMNALAPLFGGDVRAANAYVRDKVQPTAEFLPGVGDAMAAGEAADEFKQGNYGTGTLLGVAAAAGLVPGVGDVAAQGIKKGIRAYHGTVAKPFDEFSLDFAGSNTGARDAESGIWFADSPEATKYFGGYSDEMMTPQGIEWWNEHSKIREEYPVPSFGDRKLGEKPFDFMERRKVAQSKRDEAIFNRLGKEPPTTKGFEPGSRLIEAEIGGNLLEVDASIYSPSKFNEIANKARNEGYDGVAFKNINDLDESPVPHTQYLVFDPKNAKKLSEKYMAQPTQEQY